MNKVKHKIKKCPKCQCELGLVCARYKSLGGAIRRIKNTFYCDGCEKFSILTEEFKELK